MTYKELIRKFLEMIQKIKALDPAYKQPGDGSNGVCDCIGLIIGAIRRMGLKWTGIHGSNYAARYQTVDLKQIRSESVLELGDIVYKAAEKGTSKWKLPDRYFSGHQYYNGDLRDYYHVGAVTQVNPLRITHMTSPRMKVDTNLSGGWNWYGKAKPIVDAADGGVTPVPEPTPPPAPIPDTGSKAIVFAENGKPVKMRQYPSTSCRTWVNLPVGTEVKITDPGEDWAKIDGGGRKGWYMMAKFLDVVGDGSGKY